MPARAADGKHWGGRINDFMNLLLLYATRREPLVVGDNQRPPTPSALNYMRHMPVLFLRPPHFRPSPLAALACIPSALEPIPKHVSVWGAC